MPEKNMPYRVLHVINSAGWECSGIAKLASGFARGANPDLYSVECLFLRPGPLVEQLRQRGISTHVLTSQSRNSASAFLTLLRFLKERKYDVVHLHNGGRSVQCAAKWSGSRVVLQIHGLSESPGEQKRAFPVVFAHEVIVVSDFMARAMGDRRATVIHPGIEFPPLPAATHDAKDRPVIGTLGRLVPVKGIRHLLVAFARLLGQIPTARLEIAGDGPELKPLMREAERLGISASVSFLGWVERPEEVLSRWSVYVQPSLQEAAGLGVLEAAAAKLPVVASRVGGLPEMMLDGISGHLVESGDETNLANRLIELLVSPEDARKMGHAGSEFVRSRFSVARMRSDVQAVYERLMTSCEPRRIKQKTVIA